MDSDLYDEFGNYIGPDLESDSEEEEFEEPDVDVSLSCQQNFVIFLNVVFVFQEDAIEDEAEMEVDEDKTSKAIVLHEDKRYYASALEVYGPEVETVSWTFVCLLF